MRERDVSMYVCKAARYGLRRDWVSTLQQVEIRFFCPISLHASLWKDTRYLKDFTVCALDRFYSISCGVTERSAKTYEVEGVLFCRCAVRFYTNSRSCFRRVRTLIVHLRTIYGMRPFLSVGLIIWWMGPKMTKRTQNH